MALSNVEKLQRLCDKVNTRAAKGLNDDDQVAAMFAFESKINDARVIIGWDDYQAMSVEDLKEAYNNAEPENVTENEFFVFVNYNRYKCRLPIERNKAS